MFDKLKFSRLGAIAAAAIMMSAVSVANATPFTMLGGAHDPVDTPSGTTVTIAGTGSDIITDLNVYIHLADSQDGFWTYWNDMTITLEHSTISVVLNQADIEKLGLFLVTFDDQAPDNISSVVDDAVGSFSPDDAVVGLSLSAFNGHSLAGDWNLTFTDVPGYFNDAKLVAWNISGDAVAPTTAVPEPGMLALFGLGLVGLGFARRRKAA